MARPKMTDCQYYIKYYAIVSALTLGTPMRTISIEYKVGLSTVMRIKKRFFAIITDNRR